MNRGKAAKGVFAILGIALAVFLSFMFIPNFRIFVFGLYLSTQPKTSVLPVPVDGVSPGRLSDSFGAARSGGRLHKGIDIFAKRGTRITSTTKGIVASVKEDQLGGRTIRSVGPGRTVHYYAHLEKYGNVAKGQWIEAGHCLGTVGDSGNARGTPPHLHYGIYTVTGAVNPYPYLRPGKT